MLDGPRTIEFWILRACERFTILPSDFKHFAYPQQITLLAYSSIRQNEEATREN